MTSYTDPAADRCAAHHAGRVVIALCKLRWATRATPAVYLTLAPYADESDGAAVNRFKAMVDRRSRGPEKVYDSRFRGPIRVYHDGVCVWDSRDGGGP